jgi:hypothetical protein
LHPLTFAQWTPFRAIRGGATTFKNFFKKKKPNGKINILDEGSPYMMKVLH